MHLELVTIGTELLLGFTIDTNAAWLGRTLAERGIRVARRTTVADDPAAIRDAVQAALDRSGVAITTGGLGPTRDDITKGAVAALFGRRVVFNEEAWRELAERYAQLGRPLSDTNRSQAGVPEGARVLPNPRGTAPGLWLEGDRGTVIMLPGVPREMRGLIRDAVLPRLLAAGRPETTVIRSRTLRTSGIPESLLAEQLGDVDSRVAPVTLAYLPDLPGVDLRLTAWDLPPEEADRQLEAASRVVRERAAEWFYGEGATDLAGVVLDRLRSRGWRLAVAESCTGGLLCGRLTAIPGSSEVVLGGVVPYDNAVKVNQAGVPAEVLREHGAVSGPVALALAEGAARNFGARVSVGITGIAGPEGATPDKPVGTVWFGFRVDDSAWATRVGFPGSREEIRARAAQYALFALWRALPG